MELSAPKPITFWVAVLIAVIGLIAKIAGLTFTLSPTIAGASVGGLLIGLAFIVLALGVVTKRL